MKSKIIILIIVSFNSFSQNKFISIGTRKVGICIGNSLDYHGVRINFIDKNVRKINGLNFSFHSEVPKIVNGINLTMWGNSDSLSNGFTFATGVNCRKINGFGIGLLGLVGDKMNGLFITGLLGTSNWSVAYENKVNGIVIGGVFGVDAKELNGVSIGVINRTETQNGVVFGFTNFTKELHGIQFGFFNIAENNRFFKKMPLFNFNFRKK